MTRDDRILQYHALIEEAKAALERAKDTLFVARLTDDALASYLSAAHQLLPSFATICRAEAEMRANEKAAARSPKETALEEATRKGY